LTAVLIVDEHCAKAQIARESVEVDRIVELNR
jgi:hypothetical protein